MPTEKWNNIDPMGFFQLLGAHQKKMASGDNNPLPEDYPINKLAKRLHPDRQHLIVAQVRNLDDGTKEFKLIPDPELGTDECAWFQAGQYLNVFLDIKGMPITRAYSISSSPRDALDGFYTLTIKRVGGGLASNWILDHWKEGDKVTVSGPNGHFGYQPLRDAKTVVGIAGGSGITPFLSLAKAISQGDEDFNLVLLYGSRDSDNILYKEELDALENDKFKVVHVLSDEDKPGYEHGFITREIIEKYAPKEEEYSVFLCGPQAMYNFADKELDKIGLRKKFIRHELFGEIHSPEKREDYPGCDQETVNITVKQAGKTSQIQGSVHDSILTSLEKAGIAAPNRCRSGECGWCHSKLISGDVYIPEELDGRRLADKKFNYIHTCATFPLSDIELEVNPVK